MGNRVLFRDAARRLETSVEETSPDRKREESLPDRQEASRQEAAVKFHFVGSSSHDTGRIIYTPPMLQDLL